MKEIDPNALYVVNILRSEARALFGKLLKLLCRRAGITQEKLESDSYAYRDELIRVGFIQPDDETGSMNQSAISRVMKGYQPPTYTQTYIWLEVIDHVYKSEAFRKICREIGWSYDTFFDQDFKKDMYRLASFGTPEEIVAAYNRRKDLAQQNKANKSKFPPSVLRAHLEADIKASDLIHLNQQHVYHLQEHV